MFMPKYQRRDRLQSRMRGTLIKGDPEVPVTTRWNRCFLKWFFWKGVVFRVVDKNKAIKGYKIGYIPQDEVPRIMDYLFTDDRFIMRIGREDCRFFAVDKHDIEVSLVQEKLVRNPVKIPFLKDPGLPVH